MPIISGSYQTSGDELTLTEVTIRHTPAAQLRDDTKLVIISIWLFLAEGQAASKDLMSDSSESTRDLLSRGHPTPLPFEVQSGLSFPECLTSLPK